MDEATTRIVALLPVDMMQFLDRVAKQNGFKTRSRALRFCIQEEWKRQAGRQPAVKSET
jgi:metal-responsive CopG/Arc/MetJ family transcriptional regulator